MAKYASHIRVPVSLFKNDIFLGLAGRNKADCLAILRRADRVEATKLFGHSVGYVEKELFKMWCSGMSARAIHRKTDISVREVLRVVKLMKERCILK